MSSAREQWKWRNSGVTKVAGKRAPTFGVAVTVHLSERETAILDTLAVRLYDANPHNPQLGEEHESRVFPGRPAAIRMLIEKAYQGERLAPRRVGAFAKLREAFGAFWRAEASWRQVRHDSRNIERAQPPIPPW